MKQFLNEHCEAFFAKADHGYSYEQMYSLMSDLVADKLEEGVTKRQANEQIRNMMLDFYGLNTESVKNPKLLTRAMRRHDEDFFEIIEDVVSDMLVKGWSDDPFFMKYVETKNIADGDKNEFYVEDECLLSVHEVAGDHHYISVQRLGYGSVFSVKGKRYGAAVGTDLRLFLLGRVDFSKLITKLYEAFDRKIKDEIYKEFSGIGAKIPVNATFNKALQITSANKSQIDELIEMVQAANGGSDVVMIGTHSALKQLDKLTDVDWVSSNMKDEKYKTGRLGFYEGIGLVEIPQRLTKEADGTLSKLIRSDQIMVMPVSMDKPVKFVNFGNPKIHEVNEGGEAGHMDDTKTYAYEQSFGVGTIVGKYFGNITITA